MSRQALSPEERSAMATPECALAGRWKMDIPRRNLALLGPDGGP